jgi:hypothetical protein
MPARQPLAGLPVVSPAGARSCWHHSPEKKKTNRLIPIEDYDPTKLDKALPKHGRNPAILS